MAPLQMCLEWGRASSARGNDSLSLARTSWFLRCLMFSFRSRICLLPSFSSNFHSKKLLIIGTDSVTFTFFCSFRWLLSLVVSLTSLFWCHILMFWWTCLPNNNEVKGWCRLCSYGEDIPGSLHIGFNMKIVFGVIWFPEITSLSASVSNIN